MIDRLPTQREIDAIAAVFEKLDEDPIAANSAIIATKMIKRALAEAQSQEVQLAPDGAPYGIIDPDYARIFTIGRCLAWQEGYALMMHGSFTRDLDLLAVPWAENATDAERLVKRIASSIEGITVLVKRPDATTQASKKPHGRVAWTLVFEKFGDPRFVDLSVMPRLVEAEQASA